MTRLDDEQLTRDRDLNLDELENVSAGRKAGGVSLDYDVGTGTGGGGGLGNFGGAIVGGLISAAKTIGGILGITK